MYGPPYGFSLDASHNLIEHAGYPQNIDQLDLSFNCLTEDRPPPVRAALRVTNTQMGCLPYLNHSLRRRTCTPRGTRSRVRPTSLSPDHEPGRGWVSRRQVCDSNSPCYVPCPAWRCAFSCGAVRHQHRAHARRSACCRFDPSTEPHTALGVQLCRRRLARHAGPSIFDATGNDAIVDLGGGILPGIDLEGHVMGTLQPPGIGAA